MKDAHKLTQWVIDRIERDYPDDVALLIGVSGHNVGGDGHGECFDYYVPATERGNHLSETFIINGVGNDLYPRSWDRVERMVSFDDFSSSCLGNAKILYSRSDADAQRFLAAKDTFFANLRDSAFTYGKALERLNDAMALYRTMMFEDRLYKVRLGAGYIIHYLSLAIAYLNGSYEDDRMEGKIRWLQGLPALPKGFIEYIQAVHEADATQDLKNLAHLLIGTTRQFIKAHRPDSAETPRNKDYNQLREWYEEMRTTINRIEYYCASGNVDAAFGDACEMQNELCAIEDEFGLAASECDVLGAFDSADLMGFLRRVHAMEQYIISEIERHGITIRRYNSVDAFLAARRQQ